MDQTTAMALTGLLLSLNVPRNQWNMIMANWQSNYTAYPYANSYSPDVILNMLAQVARSCGMTGLEAHLGLVMST